MPVGYPSPRGERAAGSLSFRQASSRSAEELHSPADSVGGRTHLARFVRSPSLRFGLIAAVLVAGCVDSPTAPTEPPERARPQPVSRPTTVVVMPKQLTTTGGTLQRLAAQVVDAKGRSPASSSVNWSTSDPSIAIVDSAGYVWTFAQGTATAIADFPGKGHGLGRDLDQSSPHTQITVTSAPGKLPAKVADLAIESTSGTSVTLSFTEVDDGTGSPADYVIRQQVSPLDWGAAADVSSGTCATPVEGGKTAATRTCMVTGLEPDTDYQFQLVAFRGTYPADMMHGDLSNRVSATTVVKPDSVVGPDTLTPPDSVGRPTSPGRSAEHPNEPAGLSAIASVSFADSINAEVGECTETGDQWKQENSEYVADSSTPSGDGRVFRGKFPSGLDDGHSSFRLDCWGPEISPGGGTYQYQEIYVSLWLKVEGNNYQNQSVGTKIFYFAYGTLDRYNDGAIYLGGAGSRALMSNARIEPRLSRIDDDDHDTSGLLIPNLPNAAHFKVGAWNHIELRARANDVDPTRDNGELQVWVNGALATSIDNWRYRSDAVPNAFYHLQFTPVWGGNGGDVRTRDDYWRIDELYISGRP